MKMIQGADCRAWSKRSLTLAAPMAAQAGGIPGVKFPTLTYPEPAPTPDTTRGCLDLTAPGGTECPDVAG